MGRRSSVRVSTKYEDIHDRYALSQLLLMARQDSDVWTHLIPQIPAHSTWAPPNHAA